MIMQSRASLVEGALARVLAAAYLDVEIGREYRMTKRTEADVGADEKLLREALFGRNPLNYRQVQQK